MSPSDTPQSGSHQHLWLLPKFGSRAKPKLCEGSAQHPVSPVSPVPHQCRWGTGPGPTSPGEGFHPGTSPWPWEQEELPLPLAWHILAHF